MVRVPQNEKCIVIERKPSDPMRKYIKARNQQHDLFIAAFTTLAKRLPQLLVADRRTIA